MTRGREGQAPDERSRSVVVVGGGPGVYEAPSAQPGAEAPRDGGRSGDGLGGAAVPLCVPSKTSSLIADYLGGVEVATDLGVHLVDHGAMEIWSQHLNDCRDQLVVLDSPGASEDIGGRLGEVGGAGGTRRQRPWRRAACARTSRIRSA